MVRCRAIVDELDGVVSIKGSGLKTFRVEVWGEEPHDYVRIYTIPAASDNVAAREGIRRFEEEFSPASPSP